MDPSLISFAGPSSYRPNPNGQNFLPPSALQQYAHAQQYHFPPSNQSFSSESPSSSRPPTIAETHDDDEQPSQRPRNGGGGHVHTGPLVEPHQELNDFLETFWTRQMDGVENEEQDGKGNVSLPLARIKKVMKSDEEVKMISAEVPIMFSKACEVFISELTCRAWLVAESHKRRTLQRSDVAAAIAFSDMFDFLIDIVPREGEGGAESKVQSPVDDGAEHEGENGAEGQAPDGVEGEEEQLYREYVEGDAE